jgi:hypothetical protein
MLVALLLFLVAFGAVLLLERYVHRRLHEVFLLLTGHSEASVTLYSIVLLPGVALHEFSHALMATLLGVKVRKFSLRPERQRNGVVRLGYVEVLRSDNLRTSLIGAAPLIAGTVALLVIGALVFNLSALRDALEAGNLNTMVDLLRALPQVPDFWLWFYLVFAIANSMMPSSSDTQSWPPVIGFLAVFSGLVLLIGGTQLITAVTPTARLALQWLTAAFGLTALIDIVVVAALTVLTKVLSAMTGRRVEFK